MKKAENYNTKDLSHIDSVKDLEIEILRVRSRIQTNKTALIKSVKQLPKESLKTLSATILPAFLRKRLFK